MKMNKSASPLLIPLLAVLPSVAQAQPVISSGSTAAPIATGYVDFLAGLAYTDNALLTNNQKIGDGIATAGLDADYVRRGRLSVNLLGNVQRLQYLRGSFSGSFLGQFNGSAIWGRQSDPLQWQLQDTFGEASSDPLAGLTPQNLETINNVSTGPFLNLHFGLDNRLTVFGAYSRITYQRSPFDSQTYQGGIEFSHAISGASALAIQASDAHTAYTDRATLQSQLGTVVPNYDIRQGSLTYHAKFARTTILLRAGYDELVYTGGGSHGEPLYAVELTRRVSPYSEVYLHAQSAFTAQGASANSPQSLTALQTGSFLNASYATAQPYNVRSGSLGWNFRRARTRLSLYGSASQTLFNQSGASTQYNYLEEAAGLTLGRQVRPTVNAQFRAGFYRDDYSNLHASTRRVLLQLSVSKHFMRTAISFYVQRIQQSGSTGISTFSTGSYADDRVGIYVTYDLFGARGVQPSLGAMSGMGGTGY